MNKPKIRTIILMSIIIIPFLLSGVSKTQGKSRYKRKVERYQVPNVTLINQNGEKINLKEFLNSDKPVLIDFIYATCTTICPVLSVGFSNFQKRLGNDAESVRFVSISIDPDNDTPEVMKKYLERYDARPGWSFLTGRREDIIKVMKAFDAYVINKMNHYPLTILHAPGNDDWIRIYGLLSTSDLIKEYNILEK